MGAEDDQSSGRRWSRNKRSNELLQHEWVSLRTLWDQALKGTPPPSQDDITAVGQLLAGATDGSSDDAWNLLNEAEQRVGMLLSPPQMKIEFANLLSIAKTRALPSLAVHEANAALFDDPNKADEQRAAYLSLLYSLQSSFIESRLRRRLRLEVARRLAFYGLFALLLVAVPIALAFLTPPRLASGSFLVLALVATMGVLGAYFSRVMAFSTALLTLSYDDVMRTYVGRMLQLRLIYGMIGALVFYFVLRGGIVAGTIFPAFVTDTASGTTPATDLRALLGQLAPDANFAKLLVWSFIAGFSERLVGDALTRAEAQANRSDDQATGTP